MVWACAAKRRQGKQIGMIDDHDECSGECFFWYRLTRVVPDKFHRAVKRLCMCVCVCVCVVAPYWSVVPLDLSKW